jgi:hypothetical protein
MSWGAAAWVLLLAAGTAGAKDFFVVPYDATVYLRFLSGDAGAVTEFGLVRPGGAYETIFTGLPANPQPPGTVKLGVFAAGSVLRFYQKTLWKGQTYWADSGRTDAASLVAFYDIDNSLGFGGTAVEKVSRRTWLFHLDNAASFNVDDDDNDLFILMELVPQNP